MQTDNLDAFFLEVRSDLQDLFDVERVMLYTVDREKRELCTKVLSDFLLHSLQEMRVPINEYTISGYCAKYGKRLMQGATLRFFVGLRRDILHSLQSVSGKPEALDSIHDILGELSGEGVTEDEADLGASTLHENASAIVRLVNRMIVDAYSRGAYGVEAFSSLGVQYTPDFTLYRAPGCRDCEYTGYKGRMGIHELLLNTSEVKQRILNRARITNILQVARQDGMTTLLQDGIQKVLRGLTDFQQVKMVVSPSLGRVHAERA
jgi:type II secretory ATPase GspE/PulE/Tfp pilus assembly ATPase PilB-like protein